MHELTPWFCVYLGTRSPPLVPTGQPQYTNTLRRKMRHWEVNDVHMDAVSLLNFRHDNRALCQDMIMEPCDILTTQTGFHFKMSTLMMSWPTLNQRHEVYRLIMVETNSGSDNVPFRVSELVSLTDDRPMNWLSMAKQRLNVFILVTLVCSVKTTCVDVVLCGKFSLWRLVKL